MLTCTALALLWLWVQQPRAESAQWHYSSIHPSRQAGLKKGIQWGFLRDGFKPGSLVSSPHSFWFSNPPTTANLITETQTTDVRHAVTSGCSFLLLFVQVVLSSGS